MVQNMSEEETETLEEESRTTGLALYLECGTLKLQPRQWLYGKNNAKVVYSCTSATAIGSQL
jgi:hypothetical protein